MPHNIIEHAQFLVQANIWTFTDLFSVEALGTDLGEISNKM